IGSNTVTVLQGNGNGAFAAAPTDAANVLPSAVAVGDFNGDGKPDLVTTGSGGNAIVLLNNGDGTFRAGPTLAVAGAANSVVVGDFNGDGKQDVAVDTGSMIDVFLGNGNGTFQASKVFHLNNSSDIIRSLVAGDFNRDGKLDLAATVLLPDGLETSEV